jgi:hypothetical protein
MKMKITAHALGLELRDGTDDFLAHRRTAATLALVSMASLAVVALYQLGVFKRLPEPALPALDAEKVNGSAEAYAILNVPDAVLGLGSYAATLGLVAMGGQDRAQTQPWIPLALAAKAGVDTLQAAALTRKSWVNYQAFSLYSLITVLATFAAFPLVVPEGLAVWRKLTGGR